MRQVHRGCLHQSLHIRHLPQRPAGQRGSVKNLSHRVLSWESNRRDPAQPVLIIIADFVAVFAGHGMAEENDAPLAPEMSLGVFFELEEGKNSVGNQLYA